MSDQTTVALHLGFPRSSGSSDLTVSMQAYDTVGKVFDDGDSWEEWGETGTDSPSGHLVAEVTADSLTIAKMAAQALGARFGKVVSNDRHRCTWVVTYVDDWSIVLAVSNPAPNAP